MNAPTFDTIILDVEDPIAIIRLNRPDKLNALNPQVWADVTSALDWIDDNDALRAVVLIGEGRAFSAGIDISSGDSDEETVLDWRNKLRGGSQAFARRIWESKKPIVAATHGYCLAGACEIAMLCDLTIASEECKFGEPEIRFATSSPTLIMPWIVPMKIARELLYTGKLVTAQRAYEIGMVNEVVPRDKLERKARQHALLISRVAPLAVQVAKESLNRTYEIMGLVNAINYNNDLVPLVYGTETEENRKFEEVKAAEGLKAALKWRDDQFREVEELA